MSRPRCPGCTSGCPASVVCCGACWNRVPMELKHPWWRALHRGTQQSAIERMEARAAITRWLHANPAPMKTKKGARR